MTPSQEILLIGIVLFIICIIAYFRSKKFDDNIPFEDEV